MTVSSSSHRHRRRSSSNRREIRCIALSWLCSWMKGVEPSFFWNKNNNNNNNNNTTTATGFLSRRCRLQLSDRCGFLQLGSWIRYGGAPGTDTCIEECSYFYIRSEERNYTCGTCQLNRNTTTTPNSTTFDIDLDLDVPVEHRGFIRRAANKWSNIIRSELYDVPSSELLDIVTTPLEGNCDYPNIIDDIYICFQYITIDGIGGIIGRTTILATRDSDDDDDDDDDEDDTTVTTSTDGLPISSRIRFDSDDVDSLIERGIFPDLVEHELIHALGFGILWNAKELIVPNNTTNGTCTYTGTNAIKEFQNITGGITCSNTNIPNTCGHWDEDCFGREIMTNNVDFTNVLSRITIASMEDLGYDVDYSYADIYTPVEFNVACFINCQTKKKNRNLNMMSIINNNNTSNNNNNNSDKSTIILPHPPLRQRQQQQQQHRRRKISEEGYDIAVRHGREILLQETTIQHRRTSVIKNKRQQQSSSKKNRIPTIYVLYMEENELYSIPVQQLHIKEKPI